MAFGAGAEAQEIIEVRIPGSVLRSLSAPDGWRATGLSQALLAAAPWARRVRLQGDPSRFSVAWEIPEGGYVRLAGHRREAYRMLLGYTESVESLLWFPETYEFRSARSEERALVIELARPAEKEEIPVVEEKPSILTRLWERSTVSLRLLGAHRYQKPTRTGFNPSNKVLKLPRQTSEGEARLDVTLDLDRLSLSAKPRARWTRDHWQDGAKQGETDTDWDLLFLEGVAQLRFFDSLFASFGRENLQWGPGQLVNPSNPFFEDNGRENPVREIPGMDFVRAVWLPNFNWTISWISNIGRGENELRTRDWHPSHALKVEYVGYTANGGLLGHDGPDDEATLRGYGQWTATDALLLYAEASVSKGTRVLYPTEGGPLGLTLDSTKSDDADLFFFTLVGGSYTFEIGPTLSLEYVYNGEGYDDEEADEFFDLLNIVGDGVEQSLISVGRDEFDTRLRLIRRHYLFLQYLQTEIADRFNVILRWTHNLDDQSGLATAFAEWNFSDRWRLFGFGAYGSGGNRDEFGSFVRYSGLLGIELSAY